MKGDPPSNGMAGRRGEMSRRGESAVRLGRSISVRILCGLSLIFTGWGQAAAQSRRESIDDESLRALQTSSTVGLWRHDEKIGWSSFSLTVDDRGAEPTIVVDERMVERREKLGSQGLLDVGSQLQFRSRGLKVLVAGTKSRKWVSDRGDEEYDERFLLNLADGAEVLHRELRKHGPSQDEVRERRSNFTFPRIELRLVDSIGSRTGFSFSPMPEVREAGPLSALDFESSRIGRREFDTGNAIPLADASPWADMWTGGLRQMLAYYHVADRQGWNYCVIVFNGHTLRGGQREDPVAVSQLFGGDRVFAGRTHSFDQPPDSTGRKVVAVYAPAEWADAIGEDEFQIRRSSNDPRLAVWMLHERTPRVQPRDQAAMDEFVTISAADQVDWRGRIRLPPLRFSERTGLNLLRGLMAFARPTLGSFRLRWPPTVADLVGGGCISSEDCARVLVAAARYYELPARTVKGLAFSSKDRAFLPRTWCEIYVDGAWHSVDPYAQQMPPDATHLRLAPVSDAFLAKLKPLERPLIRFE